MDEIKRFLSETQDLSVRLNHLGKYAPFFELYHLNKRSDKYETLDMGVLSIGVLSYLLYEGHLKDRGVSFDEIRYFLENLVTTYFKEAGSVDFVELTRYVLDKMQNGGQPFSYRFYDIHKGQYEHKSLRYITYKRDAQLEKNLYRLTSMGIDFFLQTKEFGEESKISIQLILLRKLVDHEDFGSALRTLDNINIEIKKEAKRKNEILEELSYGITEGYENYTSRVRERLEDEQALFKETLASLEKLEANYMKEVDTRQMTEKEERFKRFVIDMHMSLSQTVELHAMLLDALVDLRQKAEEILHERRRSVFKENFSFQQYLTRSIHQNDMMPLTKVMESLFNVNVPKTFNMERIDHLLLWKSGEEEVKEIVTKVNTPVQAEPTLDTKVSERMLFNYELLMREFLFLLQEKEEITLEVYLDQLMMRYGSKVIDNYDVAPFILALCQNQGQLGGEKVFDYSILVTKEWKRGQLEAIYQKIIDDTEYLEGFKTCLVVAKPMPMQYIRKGSLEITNCKYSIKR